MEKMAPISALKKMRIISKPIHSSREMTKAMMAEVRGCLKRAMNDKNSVKGARKMNRRPNPNHDVKRNPKSPTIVMMKLTSPRTLSSGPFGI